MKSLPIGMADAEFTADMIDLADFDDEEYKTIAILEDRKKRPMIVSVNRNGSPHRYRVLYGKGVAFYVDLNKLVDYCTKNEIRIIKGGLS